MPYDFTLMRFPRPTAAGLEAPDQGPQPIQRGQLRLVLAGVAGLRAEEDGRAYAADLAGGPHVVVHVDPREPPEFVTVEFDRYTSQADYTAVRAIVDQICEALRLTITDDPDAAAVPEEAGASGGGFLARLRGLFGR